MHLVGEIILGVVLGGIILAILPYVIVGLGALTIGIISLFTGSKK